MKVIRFNTPKGQYYIPLLKVAEHRATHYVPSKKSPDYQDEIDFVMDDDFEGADWAINNTDLEDWNDFLVKLNSEIKTLDKDFWYNSDGFEIVDLEIKEDSPIKKIVLDTVNDLCSDFLYYDRKEDEDLSVEQLKEAVKNKDISIDEIVDLFRGNITETLGL